MINTFYVILLITLFISLIIYARAVIKRNIAHKELEKSRISLELTNKDLEISKKDLEISTLRLELAKKQLPTH